MKRIMNKRGSAWDPLYCLFIFAIVTAAATVIRQADLPFGFILVPALWGLGATLPLRSGDGDLISFGLTSPRLGKNIRYFLLTSLVVFPLYVVGFGLYTRWGFPLSGGSPLGGVPVPNWLLYNFLAVALFEELFFRGYLQGKFEWIARDRFSGPEAKFWIPITVSSLLFALAHMAVYLDVSRMAVFFPGLLFGWLRARTGSLLAPILSHGTANVVSMLLIGSVS
jgi:membrane protease YdiL (CAAX protease family)